MKGDGEKGPMSMTTNATQKGAPSQVRKWWRYLLGFGLLLSVVLGGVWLFGKRREPVAPLELLDIDTGHADPAVQRIVGSASAIVRDAPRSAPAWGKLGMTLLANGFNPEAAACLRHAEELDAGEVRWPYFQALAVRRTDPDTAIAKLQRALEIGNLKGDAPRLLLGELLLQRGRIEEATAQFRSVLEADSANARAHLGLGQAALQQDDVPASLSPLQQAVADPRTRKSALGFLAEASLRRGDPDAATKAQRQAAELPESPGWPDPLVEEVQVFRTGRHILLAEAYQRLESDEIPQAMELLRQAIRDYPDSPMVWLMLGRGLIRANNPRGAEQALRKSAELLRDSPETQFYLGVALFLQMKHTEAVPFFRRATELKPDYTLAYYNLGECLLREKDVREAEAAYRSALRSQPAMADAHLRLGEILARQGQRDEALRHLQQVLILRPSDTRAEQLRSELDKHPGVSKK
jgi:tetratricopeptide (TPR) repeat protein